MRVAEERYDQLFASTTAPSDDVPPDDADDCQSEFTVHILGGKWQQARTGRDIYGLRVDCRRESDCARMAAGLGISKSASFEYNKYGEEMAALLVELFKHKMLHLRRRWAYHGERVDLPLELVKDFKMPVDIEGKIQAGNKATAKRALQIMNLGC